jgi:hypothetical protein
MMKKFLLSLTLITMAVTSFASTIPFKLDSISGYKACYFNPLKTSIKVQITLDAFMGTGGTPSVAITDAQTGIIKRLVTPPTALLVSVDSQKTLCVSYYGHDSYGGGYGGSISGNFEDY